MMEKEKKNPKITSIAIVLLVVGIVVGGIGSYVVGSGQISSLQTQVTNLQTDNSELQSQVSTLQDDKTDLQSQVSSLQENITLLQTQVTSLLTDKTRLQSQVTSLQNDKALLQAQVTSLQNDKTILENRIAELEAIHNYTVGTVLTTLTGGYEDKTGPAFHIPTGNIKIVVVLTSIGDIKGFFLYLYKIGNTLSKWAGSTENAGTWVNYVYSLEEGDYYLDAASVNFNWQITVYVYG